MIFFTPPRNKLSHKPILFLIFTISAIFFSGQSFGSEDLNMDELFLNDNFFIKAETLKENSGISAVNDRSTDFSGSLSATSRYTVKSDGYLLKTIFIDYVNQLPDSFLQEYQADIDKVKDTYHIGEDDWFSSHITANFLLDIRLVDNFRGFINLDAIYYPYGFSEYSIATDENQNRLEVEEEKDTDYVLKEVFLDANIKKKVFLRFGKQVLQWGRGYFFNPTDLINIEKKRFLDMDANREGAYGLKAHIPFGVKYNIYGFIDLGSEETTDTFAYAGKFEFLLNKTEISFSSWKKKGIDPVFGLDFSTRHSNTDIIGELSLTSKEDVLRPESDFSITKTEDRWVPRCSLGLMQTYDFNEINDRITIASEVYYNHAGYSESIFGDPAKVLNLFANNMYTMYNHSVYYAVLFTEFKKFFISDLAVSLSGLGNFTDRSGIVMTQLKYTPLYDFTLEASIATAIGKNDSEYRFTGDATSIEFAAKIFF